jgi:hypothetical protein
LRRPSEQSGLTGAERSFIPPDTRLLAVSLLLQPSWEFWKLARSGFDPFVRPK